MTEKFWKIFTCLVTLLQLNISATSSSPLPVVMWHGFASYSQDPRYISVLIKIIKENVPGIQVTTINMGRNFIDEIKYSMAMPLSEQVKYACKELQKDSSLKNGYNAIGISQGALLFRTLAQRCSEPPIVNLISLVGPQQGIYGIPNCPPSLPVCDHLRGLINPFMYGYLHKWFTAAQFWHDPINEQSYIEKNSFLPDINCEKGTREEYRTNLLRLQNLVLVKASDEEVIIPRESEWFGFYKYGQSSQLYKLEDSPMYKEDCLGLKTLKESGRLHLIELQGGHSTVPEERWFISEIIDTFLK